MRKTFGERFGKAAIVTLLMIMVVCTVYPFWHIVMYSLSDSRAVMKAGILFLPKELTLRAYRLVLQQPQLYVSYWNALARTVVGTLLSMVLTAITAYPLSLPRLKGNRSLLMLIFFTMLFTGGMIPTYLVISDLGMIDTFWALIIPNVISAYNLIVLRNYFKSIPESLEESARIDGANPARVLFSIILPISGPTLAAITMFYGVNNWNSYLDGVLYINKPELQILQVYLRNLISSTGASASLSGVSDLSEASKVTEETLKMVTITISIVPMLVLYPFLQKFYTKGVMLGSVKG